MYNGAMNNISNRAFSLVELSIVLVILGLLTGGILTGQSLIRTAEMRGVTTEFQRFQSVIYSFRDKYRALPGDMPNAVRFWGAQIGSTSDGLDATCAALDHTSPATDSATCNGNGNGEIEHIAPSNYHESFRAWQHLANAGLVEGTYTGVTSTAGTQHGIPGENIYNSKVPQSGWTFITRSFPGDGYWLQRNEANNRRIINGLLIGGTTTTDVAHNQIMTSPEAWNLDKKIDDGRPFYGKVQASNYNLCTDGANATDYEAEYDLQDERLACSMMLLQSY